MIERIFSGTLTDEDLELYAASRAVMAGQDANVVALDHCVPVEAIELLVQELKEMETIYAKMAIAAIRQEEY